MTMSSPESALDFDALARIAGFDRATGDMLDTALASFVGGGDGSSLSGPLTQRLDFLSGEVEPYAPAGFSPPGVLVQTVSPTALLTLYGLPAGLHGDIVTFIHGGDGGTSSDQKGRIKLKHLHPAYDDSNGGSSATYHGFYLPNQKDWTMWPADVAIFRRDSGHVSWRCIARTCGGQFEFCVPSQIALGGDEGVYTDLSLPEDVTDNYDPGDIEPYTRLILGAHASGSSLGGLRPPAGRYYDETAGTYQAYGGTVRIITNVGPGTLTLISGHPGANAGWQFLSSANVVIPAYETRVVHYENYGSKFYMIHGKP